MHTNYLINRPWDNFILLFPVNITYLSLDQKNYTCRVLYGTYVYILGIIMTLIMGTPDYQLHFCLPINQYYSIQTMNILNLNQTIWMNCYCFVPCRHLYTWIPHSSCMVAMEATKWCPNLFIILFPIIILNDVSIISILNRMVPCIVILADSVEDC